MSARIIRGTGTAPVVALNYAHRGAHLTTAIAKEIVKAYYGRGHDKASFMGCSNGGKMGLMAVQRYPDDFDGVVAGGFVADRTKLMMMYDWTRSSAPRSRRARSPRWRTRRSRRAMPSTG